MPTKEVVNTATGEVYDQFYSDQEPTDTEIIALDDPTYRAIISGRVPFHIQKLREKNLTPDEEEYEMSLFTGGEPEPFDDYINKEVTIIGSAVIPHGPYKGKKDRPEDPLRPGYLKFLFLIDDEDKNGDKIVLHTSGTQVFSHMTNALNAYGWYLWDKPRRYRITKGKISGAYFMRNIDRKPAVDPARQRVVDSK